MTPDIIRRGEKIDRPGLYRMPINWYHDDCCVGPSISSTGIKTILECPEKYWAFSYLNPDRWERESTDAFSFGKAAHGIILEGRLSPREFAVHPFKDFSSNEDMATVKGATYADWGLRWDEAEAPKGGVSFVAFKKAWKAKAERLGLQLVGPDDLVTIRDMYQRIMRHPIVEAGGLDGLVETSLIWQDKPTGVWLKARPDTVPLGDATVNYKTCQSAALRDIARDVDKYGYYISEAMVAMGIAAVLKRQVANAGLLCQEKKPPYVVAFYELSDRFMAAGMQMIREGVDTFDRCLKANDWPAYPEDNETIIPSDRVMKRAFGDAKADIGTLDDLVTEDLE